MASDDKNKQPIIVKKIVKGGGHHGGAWKIAFADFATAMMAFFMLLWIMGSTTKEQKAAISEYFRNPSAFVGRSHSASQAQGDGTGARPSIMSFSGAVDMAPETPNTAILNEEQAEQVLAARDQERLEELNDQIQEATNKNMALQSFKDQLLIDIVPEGLRIQIVDKENRPMFDLGSAQLKDYTEQILKELAVLINKVPNHISLTGHTDARPLLIQNYSNWELSTDRANAARRALIAGGMQGDKIGRVVGFSDTIPFDKTNLNNPINRRISIIVMNKRTEDAMYREAAVLDKAPDMIPTPEIQVAPPPLSAPTQP
ncbi:flagellar motor protein MotB [Rhodoferax sp. 4810]|uniref:Flagellar motor protein MotB n=1 Tax=Thiospirillum jenense TaxID=1653858 RepID=A0A839HDB2_9GAMM|nr:flagellar motor protein MotB [Thiospirillum jenense]MBB1075818.1 flagellar motor protein MotB [Rhodoferax jenense]MBB1126893.1 flagellar motor protein MotB [Thiospirillum jenense]